MYSFMRKHLFYIIITIFGIVIAIFILKERSTASDELIVENENVPVFKNDEKDEVDEIDIIVKVDVKGEVKQPGVYEVDDTYRVIDVVEVAGGFTSEADETKINLAQKVSDEMVVIVPKTGEEMVEGLSSSLSVEGNERKINVNDATVDELSTLNGIGPKKAQAIIDYKVDNGPYRQVEDILNVSGIGEKTLNSFKEDIVVK